jgi:adenylate kinase
MNIIVYGPPGAGKGTIAELITEHHRLPHISSGDIIRRMSKETGTVAEKMKVILKSGHLIPDTLMIEIIEQELGKDIYKNGFMLDGFPRTIVQADTLDRFLKGKGRELDVVFDIQVPDDKVVARLATRRSCPVCGAVYNIVTKPPKVDGVCDKDGAALIQRDDDREEVIRNRFEVYRKLGKPVLQYYQDKRLLSTVDGDQDIPKVFADIQKVLNRFKR